MCGVEGGGEVGHSCVVGGGRDGTRTTPLPTSHTTYSCSVLRTRYVIISTLCNVQYWVQSSAQIAVYRTRLSGDDSALYGAGFLFRNLHRTSIDSHTIFVPQWFSAVATPGYVRIRSVTLPLGSSILCHDTLLQLFVLFPSSENLASGISVSLRPGMGPSFAQYTTHNTCAVLTCHISYSAIKRPAFLLGAHRHSPIRLQDHRESVLDLKPPFLPLPPLPQRERKGEQEKENIPRQLSSTMRVQMGSPQRSHRACSKGTRRPGYTNEGTTA